MKSRAWPVLMLLACGGALSVIEACSTTGPDADPRQNGCIGALCYDGSEGGVLDGPPADASTTDAPTGYGDPLAGTTRIGTLIKGKYGYVGGPVWIGTKLLFSDVNVGTMFQLNADQTVTSFRTGSGGAFGNAVDTQGRLVTCEGNRGRVTRTDAQLGNPTPVASTFNGSRFNAPYGVIARADGNIYFTDLVYGNPPDGGFPQDKMAVYRVAPGGAATRIAFDFTAPSGIALSPDGSALYVVDNADNRLLVANLNPDGSVKGTFGKVVDTDGGDGIAVDRAGNLYVAGKAGILVFDKTGKALGIITLAVGTPSGCAFGGADKKTLYITSNNGGGDVATGLYSITLNVPGLP